MYQEKSTQAVRFADLPNESFVRLKFLLSSAVVPYSATTLWRKCRQGAFPCPVKISAGITAWRVGDIRLWLADPAGYASNENGAAK